MSSGYGSKEVYRFPHNNYYFPLLLLYLLFFAAASLLFVNFLCFSFFLYLLYRNLGKLCLLK